MLVAETYASADDARTLSTLVRRLEATGCTGIATKVAEYKGSGPRAEDLIAELRLALDLSGQLLAHGDLFFDGVAIEAPHVAVADLVRIALLVIAERDG